MIGFLLILWSVIIYAWYLLHKQTYDIKNLNNDK
jgi:hypothetical protein